MKFSRIPVLSTCLLAAFLLSPLSASAAETPSTPSVSANTDAIAKAKAELIQLQQASDKATEDLTAAGNALVAANEHATQAQSAEETALKASADATRKAEVARDKAKLQQTTVNALAAQSYKSSSFGAAASLSFAFSPNPAEALHSSAVLSQTSKSSSSALDTLTSLQKVAASEEAKATRESALATKFKDEASAAALTASQLAATAQTKADSMTAAQDKLQTAIASAETEVAEAAKAEAARAAAARAVFSHSYELSGELTIPADLRPIFDSAIATQCSDLPVSILAAQIRTESGFNRYAVGPAVSGGNARGMAQFMPGTWRAHGIDGDGDGVADPFNPADAIHSAARYDCTLRSGIVGMPGDTTALMLAAYNAGPGNVKKYGGVPPFAETQNYIIKITSWAASFKG